MSISTGRWLVTGNVRFPSLVTYAGLSIGATLNLEDQNAETVMAGSGSVIIQVTRVITVSSGSQTWYLSAISGAANTVTNTTFDAYRIG
jgi:hypothetical protein